MDRKIESLLLGTRWLLLPLYAALLIALPFIYVMVAREGFELFHEAFYGDDTNLVLTLLAILDLVLVANLLVMVAVSSYESYISKVDVEEHADKPEWLGKLDSGNVKVKVALSIVMISAIHLLRAFMTDTSDSRLMVLGGIHLVFVVSALLLAFVDRAGRQDGYKGGGH
jgi:uncharacterized protein (TIGR00645 family)